MPHPRPDGRGSPAKPQAATACQPRLAALPTLTNLLKKLLSICKNASGRVPPPSAPDVLSPGWRPTVGPAVGQGGRLVARPWRLRHKLLLGLALMVAILGTLLAGSLLGLDSYIGTTKTTDSKLAELQAVEELRAS